MSLNATLSVAGRHIFMVGYNSAQLKAILLEAGNVDQKVTLFQQQKQQQSTTTSSSSSSPALKWMLDRPLFHAQMESGALVVIDRTFCLNDLDVSTTDDPGSSQLLLPSLIFINAANKATARVIARHARQLKIPVYIPDIPGKYLLYNEHY